MLGTMLGALSEAALFAPCNDPVRTYCSDHLTNDSIETQRQEVIQGTELVTQ